MTELLRLRRQKLGITLNDMAKILGLSKQLISRWELGYTPVATNRLDEYARALNLSKSELQAIIQKDGCKHSTMACTKCGFERKIV